MRDSTNVTEYDPTDENISKESNNFSEVRQVSMETAKEFSTIYFQKSSRILKPADVLMNLILPIVSNRLKNHFESKKLKGLSSANSDLNEIG